MLLREFTLWIESNYSNCGVLLLSLFMLLATVVEVVVIAMVAVHITETI